MAIQKTEAFVLRTRPFRTSSLIVTTFSRSFGKLKGIVKGVRKEGTPHPNCFEPFTLVEIVFYEKLRSELHLISEATLLESFGVLRSHLETLATAYYFSELVDQLTEPEDSHARIFELLEFAFRWLPSLDLLFLTRLFEIQLLSEIGLLPNLEDCLGCGERNLEQAYFSVRQGGLFCPSCRKKAPESILIRHQAVEMMKLFMGERIQEAARKNLGKEIGVHSDEKSAMDEIGNLVSRFITERLGKRLVTQRFLIQVRSLKNHPAGSRKQAVIHPQSSR